MRHPLSVFLLAMAFLLAGCQKEKVDPKLEAEKRERQALLKEALQSPVEHPLKIYVVPRRGKYYLADSTTNRLVDVLEDYLYLKAKNKKFYLSDYLTYNAKFITNSHTNVEYMEMYFREK